jgi:rhamnosyltransferase
MSRARVFILLATYEGEAYLPELLRSIQGQSYEDWSLLARDDGSRDATPQILREAAAKDERILIAAEDGLRRTAVGNFSWLLEHARLLQAEYFLLADQDDLWHRHKVARQVEALVAAESQAGRKIPQLVFCDAAVIDAGGHPLHASFLRQNRLPYGSGQRLETLLARSFVLGCACAVNRRLVDVALPLPDVVASHDWWLALCAAAAGRITCLDSPLMDYRRHSANASWPAITDIRSAGGGWRRRWEIGWQSFLQSLAQARSLRDRLCERGIAAGAQGELIEAFCRIVEQPGRWRRLRELHRLGMPALDWPRRLLFQWCLLRL